MLAVQADTGVPVEQGLALLDALNGDGGAFWEEYAGRVLPDPASLTIPFCLAPSLLRELQHHEVMSGAAKQQVLYRSTLLGHPDATS